MSSSDRQNFVADEWTAPPTSIDGEARPWQIDEVADVPAPAPREVVPASPAETWQVAVEAARAEGWEEGHRAGVEEGRRAEESRTRSALDAAARAVSEVEARMVALEEAARRELPALATAMASHLVDHTVETDPAVLERLIQRAVSEFLPDEPVTIRLHPRDLALLSGPMGADELDEGPIVGRTVRWISDAEVRPGGCLVETRERLVDGRLSTALERLYRALTEEGS